MPCVSVSDPKTESASDVSKRHGDQRRITILEHRLKVGERRLGAAQMLGNVPPRHFEVNHAARLLGAGIPLSSPFVLRSSSTSGQ